MTRLSKFALTLAAVLLASPAMAQSGCGGQFGAGKFCGNPNSTTGLPGPVALTPDVLAPIAGGTVIGNPTGATADPTATNSPILGIPGSAAGQIGFAGVTSGTATLKGQAAAGSATVLLPTTSGTLASTAASPLILDPVTGALTCPTCVTSSGGGAITGVAPISVSASGVVSLATPLVVQYGGTGLAAGTSGGVPYFDSTSTMASSGTLTANQIVLGGGAGGAPTVVGSLGTATTVLHGNASGAPTFGPVSLTADISGILPLANGGTNAALTASNGGLVYSSGSALAILAGTATAGQIPRSGANAAPSWSTATYPATAAAGTILNAGSANVISATATPTLGANGGTGGQITLNGATSGSAVIRVGAAAGTGTIFQVPATNGTNLHPLVTDGSGVTSWGGPALTSSTGTLTIANGKTFTANSTLTTAGVDGKTLTVNNSITLAGTDATTWTGPSTNATLAALNIASQTVTGGAIVTTQSLSTGSFTVDCGSRPIQSITNGGAFTITAPANDGYCVVKVTNNASAGTISFSGFSVGANTGDTLTTVNGSKFMIFVYRAAGDSTYSVKALQ